MPDHDFPPLERVMSQRLGSAPPRREPAASSHRPAVRVTTTVPDAPPADGGEYARFGNAEARNGLQERVEIPMMIRALGLPRGGRVLEVGCGRGVALPVLARRLVPASLTAVDEASLEPSPGAVRTLLSTLPRPLPYSIAVDRTGQIADGYEVQDEPWLVLTSRKPKTLVRNAA